MTQKYETYVRSPDAPPRKKPSRKDHVDTVFDRLARGLRRQERKLAAQATKEAKE